MGGGVALDREAGSGPEDAAGKGRTWFCLRREGKPIRHGWTGHVPLERLPARVGARGGEVIEVCITGRSRDVSVAGFADVLRRRLQGIVGIEIGYRGTTERVAPTRMIASNMRFRRVLERFLERYGIARRDFERAGTLHAIHARQYLVPVGGGPPVRMYRGSILVPPEPGATATRAAELAEGVGHWMVANLSADGALPYKYWPSRGEVSPADNAIRRFLGTLSLARLGALRDSAALRDAARRNLRWNLRRYYRDLGDGRGAIVEDKGAKLGAVALAGLAILECGAGDEFGDALKGLAAGVESLVDAEQGFRTFLFPAERDGDNWNFYSGEALLFWAEAMRRRTPFAPSPRRYAAVFERCRDRHALARNPAFVPWHTQAAVSMFALTGRREFADFAFEISDWLLPMQQWDGLAPDLRGRFHDPSRPEFGPPHAASTGAYVEGLADALALARAVGDSRRAAQYEAVIGRALRCLRQLQFRDARDMFYVSRRERVRGALRTEAYDNAVRVDSAAHALAAAIKVLRPMQFGVR